ncbi:winged helix-turn-helix domain-containing protein [Epilithonimonas sp. JDS]|uniref:winged helix-turn-helix domain-containing protein n=1 Tax=Epilithonimonas sp. JDS TaxID=2902797 RepID=UPI001E55F725|nr:winged helix-turn-helix domain-containing protein [Epilithonimonas sp. JDS]MCD9853914.1 winged helix-turn-helix domain-containing protein [Epilithonimonas sp. JDS]
MQLSQIHLSRERKYLFGFLFVSLIAVILLAFTSDDRDDFDSATREVLLRRIGHELLLQSGDKTSRVLPVKQISENEYQISFENALTFQPDSLVNLTKRTLAKDPIASDYIVNVLNCGNASVAYSYAVSKNKKDDIVACIGRRQPKACYLINIKFKPTRINTAKSGYILGGLSFLALIGFIFLKSGKSRKVAPEKPNSDMLLPLGSLLFDVKNRKLILNETITDLTTTENRVLLIFAWSPNEIIERSRLQKEIWEDDGVIVGRSLDMFISKLRKKLEIDPNIKIVVIRGKGYRLELAV